ncbi:3L protein [Yaba-like disease virus]|uniref:3L protein n=1 Tax=Yaba-like disease virus TaxID=132475 RepID=Q9DHV9_YLDV|nr:3L protein [Yaba-like disease virus]CAC21241.1 3L protein [Yaba-like disease virus]
MEEIKIMEKYIKLLSKNEFAQFCSIFMVNADFAFYDQRPNLNELLKILREEFYGCNVRLIYDIISIVSTKVCKMIKDENNNLLITSNYLNKKLNFIKMNKVFKNNSIDDIIYVYFNYKKNNNIVSCGKVFKELMKYDEIAKKQYQEKLHKDINNFKLNNKYKINLYEMFNGDPINYCKVSIGFVSILFDVFPLYYNFDTDFFNQVSIRYRMILKEELISTIN